MKIIFDRYQNNTNKIETIPFKNFGDFENYIIRLDQSEFSEVILKDNNNELKICGGRYNFIVSITIDGETFDLTNNTQIDLHEQITLMIKGQPVSFPPNLIITFEKALLASKYFHLHKQLESSLKWVKRLS
ncbi:hypothetical protein ELOC111193_17730 [Elizabethkingia occulta]|uniref:Uncharacterized protein n=1 Tax=Elizabethkingia occulta TaxID=1867263 RepID=A0A1T3MMM8_9FLAO|nr:MULTISPECIES: hypothetical protein [Weeksellaceae]OPC65922.1 hypothetical protein BAZ10_01420 [Elizabethkingia occulta]